MKRINVIKKQILALNKFSRQFYGNVRRTNGERKLMIYEKDFNILMTMIDNLNDCIFEVADLDEELENNKKGE